MRRVLTKLTEAEFKIIKEATEKFRGDGNQINYEKSVNGALRLACGRIKKEVGEVDLLNDGTICLKYERMTEHELRIMILLELEAIRDNVVFQTNFLKAQLVPPPKPEDIKKEGEKKNDRK